MRLLRLLRPYAATLAEIAGVGLVCGGVAAMHLPSAFILAGVALVVMAAGLDRRRL